ncbi:hypothetical protein CW354_04210 [Marinicaulis flavus]|uniref:Uncharacterized protein n=1 Tax=Hyphococcus luteus TaxID=2058213 RepID=A0A2S7K9I3_9PROT|nr:hypothetical protein CW354_04210 [Marinicaulis flavus]
MTAIATGAATAVTPTGGTAAAGPTAIRACAMGGVITGMVTAPVAVTAIGAQATIPSTITAAIIQSAGLM